MDRSLPADAPVVLAARRLASEAHVGQERKANRTPYLSHVTCVAKILAEARFDDQVVAAGLLHDIVEHTDVGHGAIRTRFGDRIATLVEAMTDRDEIEGWEERKNEHRQRISRSGRDAAAIYAADKVCGVRETRQGYAELAEEVEERLGNTLDQRLRTWDEDLRMLASVEPPLALTEELAIELTRLRDDRAISAASRS